MRLTYNLLKGFKVQLSIVPERSLNIENFLKLKSCLRSQSGFSFYDLINGFQVSAVSFSQFSLRYALFRYRTVYKRFAENGQTMEEYSENASEAKERIRARAALSDIEKIGSQINSY